HAQNAAFEVVSIKPAAKSGGAPGFCIVPCSGENVTVTGSRVDIHYISLHQLILLAYRIKPYQLSGPDWMRAQRFDVAAKMPDGRGKEKLPEILKAMLEERFQLKVHRNTREQPVYALVVGKNGARLRASSADPETPLPAGGRAMYSPQ